jgi:hypothetical protein
LSLKNRDGKTGTEVTLFPVSKNRDGGYFVSCICRPLYAGWIISVIPQRYPDQIPIIRYCNDKISVDLALERNILLYNITEKYPQKAEAKSWIQGISP